MKRLLNFILLKLKLFLAYLPSRLPVGKSEFETWSKDVIDLAGEFADEASMKFALATQILHYDAKKSYVPKIFFIRCLEKAAANQVASYVFQEIKQAQDIAIQTAKAAELALKEAEAKVKAETTTLLVGAPSQPTTAPVEATPAVSASTNVQQT